MIAIYLLKTVLLFAPGGLSIIFPSCLWSAGKVTLLRMKSHQRTATLVAVFLSISGCSSGNGPGPEDKPIVQVDGQVLTLAEFNQFFAPLGMDVSRGGEDGRPLQEEARLRFLLEMVEEMIILRRAEELGLYVSSQELEGAVGQIERGYREKDLKEIFVKQAVSSETWKERLRRRLLVEKVIQKDLLDNISVEPEEIREYYNRHHEEWSPAERIRAYQIVVFSEDEANRLLARLKEGEDFAALARLSSRAPEADRGGDMGYVARGELPECIEDPLFALEEDTLSPVIKTPYGYHILQVVEKRAADEPLIDQWTERIKGRIREEKLEVAYGPWLADLKSRYSIVVHKEMI
jgi:parvulin-like peptidyl-prolyl isomerase